MNEDAFFAGALEHDSPEERAIYLDRACAGDAALRARVEALLAAHGRPDSLLDEPLVPKLPTTIDRPADLEQPGTQIGRYKLLEEIGEGGFGVVYMAEQLEPVTRRVALKIIKPGMDTRAVIARFEAERQALAMMDHPNIAKVLDAGTTGEPYQLAAQARGGDGERGRGGELDLVPALRISRSPSLPLSPSSSTGRPYFVMERVHGVPITQFCDEAQLTPRERLALFIPVCQAIQHAHQKGIIHRDIKPSNILVCLYDGRPVPKVIDFGMAKALQQRLTEKTLFTQFGQVVGTLEYMSPEQAETSQLDIDTRSDVYSLGAVLYELLTGTPPVERKRLQSAAFDEILRIIREEEPPRPSLRLSSSEKLVMISAQRKTEPARLSRLVHGELDWIVMKALDKQRSRRYDSANDLANDIERYLQGESITAVAPTTMYRVRKYVRRHKAALAVAATVVGLLVTGTAVTSALAVRAVRSRSNERAQRIVAERHEKQAEQERRKAAEAQQRAERLAYSAAMALASSDWEHGNLVRLERTLEATESYPDLGFEWYHRQDQLHQDLRTAKLPLPGMALSSVYGITVAEHGGMIIVNSSSGTYVLDADSADIRAAYGFSVVSSDGRWIATGGTSLQRFTLVDTKTGIRRPIRLPEHEWLRAISPDGTRVATVHLVDQLHPPDESRLRVWDTKAAKQAYEISVAPQSFSNVYFSPDGQWIAGVLLASDAGQQQLKLWRVSDGEETRAIKNADFGYVFGFTPNSKHVVRVDHSRDGPARGIHLHNTANLADVKRIPADNLAYLRVAFSPDSKYLAAATDKRTIVIKDIETNRTLATYRGHKSAVQAIAFSHDGSQVITCSADGSIKFWPVEGNNYIPSDARVIGTWLSADGTRLLAQTIDAPTGAQLIDVASKRIVQSYREVFISNIFPDGRRVVTAPPQRDGAATTPITISDDTGKALKTFACDPHVNRLSVSPDGRRILVASDTSFNLLDADTGKVIFRRPQNGSEPWSTAFSPDGKRLALSFLDEHCIRICDTETGRMVDSIPLDADAREGSHCADYSRDGRQILIAYQSMDSLNHGVSIYDVATKKRIQRIVGHARPITAASFFPDGRRIITASQDRSVRLWDVENGFELLSLRADENPAVAVTDERTDLYYLAIGLRADETIAIAVAPSGSTIAIPARQGIFLAKAATPRQVSAWRTEATQPRDDGWWSRQGGVRDWLVLAPIAVPLSANYGGDLDREQLTSESDLDPRPGDDVRLGEQELTWQQISIDDWALDFHSVAGPGHDYCVGYAVSHIHSDKAREEARLLVGSDDLAKIYLNGDVVYEFRRWRPMFPADDEILVNLRKGKNVLVFKVIDLVGDWGATAQLVGEDYQPIPGVTTGLEP